MIRQLAYTICFFFAVAGPSFARDWQTYEGCELLKGKFFDGDSFTVKAPRGHTYVFRLYGVDCPETDDREFMQQRITEQRKDFNLKKDSEVIEWGKKATAFTENFLSKPFTVCTQKVDAGGIGKKKRYYAIILNSEGERLDEALVEAGLARVYGYNPEWKKPFWRKAEINLPRECPKFAFQKKLKHLEAKAKAAKVGVWAPK